PVKETTAELFDKAHRALEAARRDLDAGDADNAVARIYYAVFHAATAALHEDGLAAKSHPGTQQLFFERFVRSGRMDRAASSLFASLYQMRQEADYASGKTYAPARAAAILHEAE